MEEEYTCMCPTCNILLHYLGKYEFKASSDSGILAELGNFAEKKVPLSMFKCGNCDGIYFFDLDDIFKTPEEEEFDI
jgi:hypothetical protein